MVELLKNFFNNYNAVEFFFGVFLFWLSFFALPYLAKLVLPVIAKFMQIDTNKWFGRADSLKDKVYILGIFALVGCGALIPIDVYVTYFGNRPMSSNPEQWGQMGDFFGGMLNPILAFASFIALLYTIRIQSKTMLEYKESQAHIQFESAFLAMHGQLKQLYRPDIQRKKEMLAFLGPVNYDKNGLDGEEGNSRAVYNHLLSDSMNERNYFNFLSMFFDILILIENSTHIQKKSYLRMLSSSIDNVDCYYLIGLIHEKRINSHDPKVICKIANDNAVFKQSRYDGFGFIIGCDDGRKVWYSLCLKDIGLTLCVFRFVRPAVSVSSGHLIFSS